MKVDSDPQRESRNKLLIRVVPLCGRLLLLNPISPTDNFILATQHRSITRNRETGAPCRIMRFPDALRWLSIPFGRLRKRHTQLLTPEPLTLRDARISITWAKLQEKE